MGVRGKRTRLMDTPLHTNKAVALQKRKRAKVSLKSKTALDSGDLQAVIDSLSDRQRQFAEEYLVDLNATAAVTRCGYKTKYPNRIAYQLMENPAIRVAIDALRAERSKQSDVTKDFVLRKIVKTLESAEADGNHNATLRAAELLARHLGMFVERTEISGPDGDAIEIKKIEEDVADFTSSIVSLAERSRKTG